MQNELFSVASAVVVSVVLAILFPVSSSIVGKVTSGYLELSEPFVIAHRGASAVAPENTRAAIAEAIRMKVPWIEFDVRATSDDELVLFHDGDLERLAGRKETLESMPWSEFATTDVGKWFGNGRFAGEKPIKMCDAIGLCLEGGAIPLIEHKTGSADLYASVLRDLKVVEKVVVQSFNWNFLSALQKELPDLSVGALGKESVSDQLAELKELDPDLVGWKYQDLKSSDVEKIHGLDAKVAIWTVNDPASAKQWVAAGVDGIITDVPDKISKALQR